MVPNRVFDNCQFQTFIMGEHDEPTPIVSATNITGDEIINAIDGIDANGTAYECAYPNNGVGGLHRNSNDSVDALRYATHDIDAIRNYERRILGRFHDTMSREECVIYTRERAQIIKILKREKNVNTKKCMYVDDLVKEIAKIMEVRL